MMRSSWQTVSSTIVSSSIMIKKLTGMASWSLINYIRWNDIIFMFLQLVENSIEKNDISMVYDKMSTQIELNIDAISWRIKLLNSQKIQLNLVLYYISSEDVKMQFLTLCQYFTKSINHHVFCNFKSFIHLLLEFFKQLWW